ncbi:hypothetical protein AX16_007483 [Volvariella volvacea WC 439]|nr:hypothetical protein AX16_007483 [Volvariella volvacea WC 439]
MAQNPLSPLHKEEFHSFNSPNTHHPPSIARDGLYNRNSVRIASLSFRRLIVDIFKTLLLPAITVGFLAFCYTVQNQTVLVDGRGLVDVSPQNLAAIKSGITTISILVISLGLWPIKNLITDMRGEEFLRSLKRSKDGVDLATANSVSSISVGTFQTIAIILRRRCSPHFFIAFISGFIVIAASALAPAALSVQDALRDSDVIAFEVAAVPMSSVINMTDFGISGWIGVPTSRMSGRLQEAASISWAEAVLGLGYSFNTPKTSAADSPQYIVPLPVKLSPTTNARWITDAFYLMNPSPSLHRRPRW